MITNYSSPLVAERRTGTQKCSNTPATGRTSKRAGGFTLIDLLMGFVDGHTSFVKIYWNGVPALEGFPLHYEPKAGYDYKWSGN